MGTFHTVNHWKTLQYPKTQSWNVAIFAGSCWDQQMVLWNKSSSGCFWYPATLSAAVVSAAMTVYINRGSHLRSALPDVQCGDTKLSSLPCDVSTATLIYFAFGHPSRVWALSAEHGARFLGWVIGLPGLSVPGQALAAVNLPPCAWSLTRILQLPV